MTAPVPLHVWVLSYNRGPFLRHCVETVRRCCPWAAVTVLDDDSEDPETRRVLEELDPAVAVRRPADLVAPGRDAAAADGAPADKHGGLHANMQAAFASMADEELFCFLQDDMQLVRPVGPDELAPVAAVLRGDASATGEAGRPRLAQPAFMKGRDRRRDARRIRFDPALGGYLVDRFHRSAGAHYSDVCLGHVGALRAAGWAFVTREAANERAARTRLAQMITLRDPFAAWLPGPPAYRGRRRTLALRLGERIGGCGFHPLAIMDAADVQRLRERDPRASLPWAEAFLRTAGPPCREPWIYVPTQAARWVKWLHSVETRLRRSSSSSSSSPPPPPPPPPPATAPTHPTEVRP